MSEKKTIVVLGSTGKQGSAVIRALDRNKYNILAVTRNANSDKFKALGIDVRALEGTLDKPDFLFHEPVHGIFMYDVDPGDVQTQGVLNAAIKHDVKHIVYSGVDLCGSSDTGVPFFEGKREVENSLRQTKNQWTILHPVGFMEFYLWPLWQQYVAKGWNKDMQRKLISVVDIGRIAAAVFDQPELYNGKTLNIAGDSLSHEQILETFERITGNKIEADTAPDFPPHLAKALRFFDLNEFEADPEETRALFPGTMSFEQWLRTTPAAKA
ncbi:hypothetical protein IAU60_006849 [Kwoniella sp. DSM 27419]